MRRGRRRFSQRIFRALYACGAAFGAVGLVVALALLAANFGSNTLHLLGRSNFRNAGAGGLGDKLLSAQDHSQTLARTGYAGEGSFWEVKPIMPGVNLPLVHLGYVFAAVLISLVVHEGGDEYACTHSSCKRDMHSKPGLSGASCSG